MYCPQCGQQQFSDNTRFCSRCGLPIGRLSDWLASGGALKAGEETEQAALPSPRRKGIRRGAKLMFISAVLLPICFGLSFMADHPAPMFITFTVFLAGLSLMLYSRLFGEEIAPAKSAQPQWRPSELGANSVGGALPPASNLWANEAGRRPTVRTSELAQPPSVTEHTTKLLDSD